MSSKGSYTKKIKGEDYSKNTYNFILDFSIDYMGETDLEKINRLKTLIYFMILAKEDSIVRFTLDLISLLESDAVLRK